MTLIRVLTGIVGSEHVLVDPDLRASYEVDWTGRFRGPARCVVRPGNTAEVVAVMRACSADGAALTVQGGNTGLVGGGVPAGGEVLLSLARLNQLDPVDSAAAQVTAGAGVTLEALQVHARTSGLEFGVDLAARSQATVGGLIATNAGGVRVVRHGSMRAQVVGVEAVLADGTVLSRLTPPPKDNTGYDLTQLLCGSEGTLAVITKARLRLVAPPTRSSVALVGLASTSAALGLLAVVKARLTVTAVEIFYAEGLSLVRTVRGLIAPFAEQFPTYVVLECTDGVDELVETLAAAEVGDATVASDAVGKARLWAYRESHTEAISTVGVPVKLDICVPLAELPSLVDTLPGAVPARTIVFGHLNEGNLHVNILGAEDPEEVTDTVLKLVAAHHGSISSEHGVGRAKTRWLQLTRTPEEISTMRLIKRALDPDGILNPGVLLPDLGR